MADGCGNHGNILFMSDVTGLAYFTYHHQLFHINSAAMLTPDISAQRDVICKFREYYSYRIHSDSSYLSEREQDVEWAHNNGHKI